MNCEPVVDGIEGDVYVDANLIAHWAKLGFVEEDVIRNHILQSLISHPRLCGHQAGALIILLKLAGATFEAYAYPSMVGLKRKAWIGPLEEITTSLRRPHRKSPLRREWVTTAFTGRRRRNVFRFSSQLPDCEPPSIIYPDFVGGRYHGRFGVSELDVGRGEILHGA